MKNSFNIVPVSFLICNEDSVRCGISNSDNLPLTQSFTCLLASSRPRCKLPRYTQYRENQLVYTERYSYVQSHALPYARVSTRERVTAFSFCYATDLLLLYHEDDKQTLRRAFFAGLSLPLTRVRVRFAFAGGKLARDDKPVVVSAPLAARNAS